MKTENSITDFFYNLIPGVLFLASVVIRYKIDSSKLNPENTLNDSFVFGLVVISLSLALGFFFQAVTKEIRKYFQFNNDAMEKVKTQNPELYSQAIKYINIKIKKNEVINNFYLMDNYLRGGEGSFIVNHFSSRLAFWSNFFIATSFFILIRIFWPFGIPLDQYDFIALLFWCLTLRFFKECLDIFYDCILKTFVMIYPKK